MNVAHIDKGRRDIDWSAIEQDYRAGGLSLREMARKHNCSHSTIASLATRNGWSRATLNRDGGGTGTLSTGAQARGPAEESSRRERGVVVGFPVK